MSFKRISVEQSKLLLENDNVAILDVRDQQSFEEAHIENAIHLDESKVTEFLKSQEKSHPLLVYCYHGNSSQSAADYFAEQGFSDVYSMDGGFEEWRSKYSTL